MSADGPHPTTRLVLLGHWQFMNRDGTGCWAGVRRLGIATGLDKSTVAKHRALAITAGWLIASKQSAQARFRHYLAAVPDQVAIRQSGGNTRSTRSENVRALSGRAGQSSQRSSPPVSALTAQTVRPEEAQCPTSPDKPLVLPLRPLTASGLTLAMSNSGSTGNVSAGTPGASRRLQHWLRTDGFAQRYRDSHDLVIAMTPSDCKFNGYEDIIRGRPGRGDEECATDEIRIELALRSRAGIPTGLPSDRI
jgi:hypothetical protein